MRWTRELRKDERKRNADGEVVWSWRPDAGAKFTGFDEPCGRRGQESPVPGEITKDTVKTIAQGMPDDLAEPVVTAACFLLAGGPWVRPSPGIPCALLIYGGWFVSQT